MAVELAGLQRDDAGDRFGQLCMSSFIQPLGADLTFTEPEIARLTPAVASTDAAYGWRVAAVGRRSDVAGKGLLVTIDLLAFSRGTTVVHLWSMAMERMIKGAERDALFAKLVTRVEANGV